MNHGKRLQALRAKTAPIRRRLLLAKCDRNLARHWKAHDRASASRLLRSVRAFSVVTETFARDLERRALPNSTRVGAPRRFGARSWKLGT
jgi:hypothetical protein